MAGAGFLDASTAPPPPAVQPLAHAGPPPNVMIAEYAGYAQGGYSSAPTQTATWPEVSSGAHGPHDHDAAGSPSPPQPSTSFSLSTSSSSAAGGAGASSVNRSPAKRAPALIASVVSGHVVPSVVVPSSRGPPSASRERERERAAPAPAWSSSHSPPPPHAAASALPLAPTVLVTSAVEHWSNFDQALPGSAGESKGAAAGWEGGPPRSSGGVDLQWSNPGQPVGALPGSPGPAGGLDYASLSHSFLQLQVASRSASSCSKAPPPRTPSPPPFPPLLRLL